MSVVLDAARTRAARPLSEFFQRPQLPIREVYMYRFLVNMVWYARNYLNIVFIVTFVAACFYPWFFLTLFTTLQVQLWHSSKYVNLWKLLQLATCYYIYSIYGILPGAVTTICAMGLIAAHATFTPYTDEASRLYDELTVDVSGSSQGPLTPVTLYQARTSFEAPPVEGLPPTGAAEPSTIDEPTSPILLPSADEYKNRMLKRRKERSSKGEDVTDESESFACCSALASSVPVDCTARSKPKKC